MWGTLLLLTVALALSVWRDAEASAHIPPSYTASGPVCLMTFNIRHAKGLNGQVRLSAIRDEIRRSNAGFAALQEVDRFQWRSGMQDQAKTLAVQLGMNYAFAPAMRNGVSEYGVVLLSRYPLTKATTYPLPGEREPRVVLSAEVRLTMPDGRNKALTLVTTHLGVSRADRERQLPELVRIVKSLPAPVILMGDFNMSGTDPLMKQLNKALYKVSLSGTASTVANGGEIDHIFTSAADFFSAGKAGAWTEPTLASDHAPVLHKIKLP